MFCRSYAQMLGATLAALLGLAACVERPATTVAGPSFDISSNPVASLPSGTTVTFFLATAGNLPDPDPGPPTDVLVFTGRPTFLTTLPECNPDQLLVQDAVLVDAAGGGSSQKLSVFQDTTYGQGQLIPPGTRLLRFQVGDNCTSGGLGYRKYTASVE